MGNPTGFKEHARELPQMRDPESRVEDYNEFYKPLSDEKINQQAARCMDCGVPFCQSGCPLGNRIPEFNDAVYNQNWDDAARILFSTNNFPEFTGRICPAPCEGSCVLGINKPPVTIEFIEKTIADYAFENNLVPDLTPENRTGKKVAIVGSGPAGLASAEQLNKSGHDVVVFERAEAIGGLLRLGIPDFKLDKSTLDRRLSHMEAAGIVFKTNMNIGVDISCEDLENQYDAIVLCGGATIPRDMDIPGRSLNGVHFAMDFLSQQNNRVANRHPLSNHEGKSMKEEIIATDKHVVVIGGGDTGSDCVGTSNRHGAKSIEQFELLDKPPGTRGESNPWPQWPLILRTSSSHEEGVDRKWAILTKEFISDGNGNVKALRVVDLEWIKGDDGNFIFSELKESEREIPCDLALLAVGFLHGDLHNLKGLEFKIDSGNFPKSHKYQTTNKKVFAAGDVRRGQSLVVWAISEGREAAYQVDKYLMGSSHLELKDKSVGLTIR